jgi:GAF domain-containing protein
MEEKKKQARYKRVYDQIFGLMPKSQSAISRMATIIAVLHHKFDYYFWTGFYLYQDNELIVGPYQGPLACQVLQKHTGVCWAAIERSESVIVPDVEKFPGHIACDSRSKSEIVIPVYDQVNQICAVLDVDSKSPASFDDTDRKYLEDICKLIHI